jgi:hypothetical protein
LRISLNFFIEQASRLLLGNSTRQARRLSNRRGIFVLMFFTQTTLAGLPQELWPLHPEPAAIQARLADGKKLEPELWPAVEFQQVFCEILTGAPPDACRGKLEKFLQPAAHDPVAQGVAEVARAWLARAWMLELDQALRKYYRRRVEFPAALEPVFKDVPEKLHLDPWGQPWVYTRHAPEGFSRQVNQRYQLGPARYPLLAGWHAAIQSRTPVAVPWQISVQTVGGERSLQFRTQRTSALIQPGGSVDGHFLLFIGDRWALLAAPDQLFTVTF